MYALTTWIRKPNDTSRRMKYLLVAKPGHILIFYKYCCFETYVSWAMV